MSIVDSNCPYEMEINILPEDIDQLGHVNNVVYLKWVQEVATAHWYASATKEQKSSLLWVVAKHEIKYKRPAFVEDIVIARTWIGKAKYRFFQRHTDLLRKSDRKRLAKAVTLWTPVDMNTRIPITVGSDIYEMFST